jgi:hypothetical protein
MCDNINFVDGKQASNQGELKKILGGEIVADKGYGEDALNDDMCLCPVDFKETAKLYGYTASKNDLTGEYDSFDTWFYKMEQPND